jgi:hypothetical protein
MTMAVDGVSVSSEVSSMSKVCAIDDESGRRPDFYCNFTSIAVIQ